MLRVTAVRADVHRHVLHDAQDRHADLLEHLDALARVEQRDVLRRGDDHRARHRHALAQRELDVAGARRHVDDQVVEVFPVGLAQQLLERLRGHGAAPDHGLVGVDQEADRHHLHAMALLGLHVLAVDALGAPVQAHHHGLARAVDVGVEQAHGGALGGQRQRQVGGRGALAHAALARGHGHDVAHVGHQLHAALHRMADDPGDDVDRHVLHARHGLGRGHQRLADGRVLALGGVAEFEVERDIALGDLQVFERAGRCEFFAGVRVRDALECVHEPVGGECH
ncbi:hypothetical protein D9M69_480350 [compost metagenome]